MHLDSVVQLLFHGYSKQRQLDMYAVCCLQRIIHFLHSYRQLCGCITPQGLNSRCSKVRGVQLEMLRLVLIYAELSRSA